MSQYEAILEISRIYFLQSLFITFPSYLFLPPTVVRMKIGYQNDPNNFLLEEEEWQTSINISSANFAKNGRHHLISKLCNAILLPINASFL